MGNEFKQLRTQEKAAALAPDWDGEGLPPVGVECECWHTGTHQGVVTVRYMGSEMCVLLNHEHGEEQCGPIDAYSFRPILSEPCRYHGYDTEACEMYSGQVPCDPEAPEWDGVMWPPLTGSILESKGVKAEVLAVRNGQVIGCEVDTGVAGWLMRDECRPIRSEEDTHQ